MHVSSQIELVLTYEPQNQGRYTIPKTAPPAVNMRWKARMAISQLNSQAN